jgi:hypothetical protein
MKKSHRQGDLLFVPMSEENQRWRLQNLTKNSSEYRKDGVIQLGEATGHHHAVEDPTKADVYRFSNGMGQPIVVVHKEGVRVIHGGSTEVDDKFHAPITLDPDTAYEVHIAQETDISGNMRRVVD